MGRPIAPSARDEAQPPCRYAHRRAHGDIARSPLAARRYVYRDAAILCHMFTPAATLGARGSRDSTQEPLPLCHVGPIRSGSVPAPVLKPRPGLLQPRTPAGRLPRRPSCAASRAPPGMATRAFSFCCFRHSAALISLKPRLLPLPPFWPAALRGAGALSGRRTSATLRVWKSVVLSRQAATPLPRPPAGMSSEARPYRGSATSNSGESRGLPATAGSNSGSSSSDGGSRAAFSCCRHLTATFRSLLGHA